MTYDDAVKRWVATTYHLPLPEVEQVTFDVQDAVDPATLNPLLLEIDVHMTDHTQHLFVRKGRDFGTIVQEVLAQAG
jgi:hypothetical protein